MEKDRNGPGDLSVPFPNVDTILCLLLCSILETKIAKIPVTWDKCGRAGRAFLCKWGQLLWIRFSMAPLGSPDDWRPSFLLLITSGQKSETPFTYRKEAPYTGRACSELIRIYDQSFPHHFSLLGSRLCPCPLLGVPVLLLMCNLWMACPGHRDGRRSGSLEQTRLA